MESKHQLHAQPLRVLRDSKPPPSPSRVLQNSAPQVSAPYSGHIEETPKLSRLISSKHESERPTPTNSHSYTREPKNLRPLSFALTPRNQKKPAPPTRATRDSPQVHRSEPRAITPVSVSAASPTEQAIYSSHPASPTENVTYNVFSPYKPQITDFSSDIPEKCHQHWLVASKQNMVEQGGFGAEKLYIWEGNLKNAFDMPSEAADKYSTTGLRAAGSHLPSLVVLSVREDAHKQASEELSNCFSCGSGAVNVAILVVWEKFMATNAVECQIYVTVRGNPYTGVQTFTSRWPNQELEFIKVTVGQLFGKEHLPPELWSKMEYKLSLKLLCQTAAEMLEAEIQEQKERVESEPSIPVDTATRKISKKKVTPPKKYTTAGFSKIVQAITKSPPQSRVKRLCSLSSETDATKPRLRRISGEKHLRKLSTGSTTQNDPQPKIDGGVSLCREVTSSSDPHAIVGLSRGEITASTPSPPCLVAKCEPPTATPTSPTRRLFRTAFSFKSSSSSSSSSSSAGVMLDSAPRRAY